MASFEEHILSFVMQDADILVLLISSTGIIEKTNRSATNLIGKDLVGVPFEEMLIDFQGRFSYRDAIEQQGPMLLNVVKTDGLPLTYYFHFKKMGEEVIALGQQDAGEVDTMRRSLLELNNDLNNATRELQKKNVQLEKLNEQKNKFFGMASHDLRNPLGIINMYSQFLEMEASQNLVQKHKDFLAHIRHASDLMEDILNDFLDFSIFESGRLVLHKKHVDINNFISQISEYWQPFIEQKNVSMRCTTTETPLYISLDESKMKQVINNLVSNALKFTDAGGQIRIKLVRKDAEIQIQVHDSGPGIDDKDITRIFLPYERVAEQVQTKQKSSGLGLAIVKAIIDAHGGKVWAESVLGEGASFFVSLKID